LCGSRQKPVLVVGSLNADVVIEIHRLPKRGETVGTRRTDTAHMVPGGKGANQAVAAARLARASETHAQFICQLGNDTHATALEKVLKDNGLDLSACGHADAPSGQAFIFLEADGQNSIMIVGGANAAWPKEAAEQPGLQLVRSAKVLLLQREIPEHVNEAMAEVAAKNGVPVMQDVGGEDRPLSDRLLRNLSFITPNETELERITGMPATSETEIVEAARALQERGVRNVLVTLGAGGAIWLTGSGQIVKQDSFPVPGGEVVDTTGAGDAFRAAFAVAYVEGRTPKECLKFAAAAASIAVSRLGAIPSLPHRKEVDMLMKYGHL